MKILIGAGFVIEICTTEGVKLCNVSRVSCIEFAGSRLWSVTDIYCLSAITHTNLMNLLLRIHQS